ncbi:membrane protein insertion efficiency factor YidD [Rubricoccus marinus]|nr:membrane protein insertion efficiency factor YidD [Rubricoccus marinus]
MTRSPLLMLLVWASGAAAQADGWDWGWSAPDTTWAEDALLHTLDAPEAGLGQVALRYYQREVSPRMARPCPAWPSCSMYARYSVGRWGLVPGSLMTIDRLFFRENAAFVGGQTTFTFRLDGRTRVYDPPDANTAPTLRDWRQLHPNYRARFHPPPDELASGDGASGARGPQQRRGVGI